MPLTLFNTLTRKKEVFTPLTPGKVKMYSCGPTVYNYAHLGNLRAYVFMDCLHRVLRYDGFSVQLVVNITDVGHLTDDADTGEDKMEKGAQREGKTVWDVAKFYTEAFMHDIKLLNILEPTVWCRATDHIMQQEELTQKILDNGHAYRTSDGIYFDTSTLSDYGKLIPNFNPESLEGGKRVELGEKRHKTDFALWKFSPKNEQRAMEWESTFIIDGKTHHVKGFPGWHIECTAMGCHYLGKLFDVHTGGIDHIPVHHTNEIAQAEGAFGHDHVRYWLHNEFLLTEKEKMAKSAGNFLRMQSLLDNDFDALDYRYFLLQTHYRKAVQFSWEALSAAKTARKRLMDKIIELKSADSVDKLSKERLAFQTQFVARIQDDLDFPGTLALVHDVLKSTLADGEKLSLLLDWDAVLGLGLKHAHKPQFVVPDAVQELLVQREHARKKKDWKHADALRDEVALLGWVVSDTPEGQVVHPK